MLSFIELSGYIDFFQSFQKGCKIVFIGYGLKKNAGVFTPAIFL